MRNRAVFEALVELLSVLIKPVGFFSSTLRRNLLFKICEVLNLPPVSPIDTIRRKFGDNGLKQAYGQNLRLVLEHTAKLVEDFSGVIVITSDHGEYLGERGRYGHFYGRQDPLLLEVPWLVVEKAVTRKNLPRKEKKRAHTCKNSEKIKRD